MKAAIYARGKDIAYQVGATAAFIIDRGLDYAGLYVDDDGSYEALEMLITEFDRGNVNLILVRDMDIISERTEDLLRLGEEIPVCVIGAEDLYCTRENLDLETLKYVDLSKERQRQAQRNSLKKTLSEKKERGEHLGANSYGIIKEEGRLIVDPDKAGKVKEIFELAIEGKNPKAIADHLNEKGAPTSKGGKKWSRDTVQIILMNAVYRDLIIDKDVFDKVQSIFAEKAAQKLINPFPMARCALCNSKLTFQGPKPNNKLTTATYQCKKHTAKSTKVQKLDENPKITLEEMERQVIEACNEYFQSRDEYTPYDEDKWQEVVAKKIELGEKLLQGNDVNFSELREQYHGLWLEWVDKARRLFMESGMTILHQYYNRVYGHMDKYSSNVGEQIIKSIKLYPDGTVKVGFVTDINSES